MVRTSFGRLVLELEVMVGVAVSVWGGTEL